MAGIDLPAAKAVLEGERIDLEDKIGRPNIGFWDRGDERVHWLVHIPEAGTYRVRAEVSTPHRGVFLELQAEGASVTAELPATGSFEQPVFAPLGPLRFDRPGVVHLCLQPARPDAWKAVNLWRLQLAKLPAQGVGAEQP